MGFDCLFDGTGAIQPSKSTVAEQINLLEATVFRPPNERERRPRPKYLLIGWGALLFKCCLESMSVTYKLFSPEGQPLRASVQLSFIEVEREALAIGKIVDPAQDMSKVFTVKEGDSLPKTAENAYGDKKQYIAVAQANKLTQFRNLPAGKQIILPPLKKNNG